MNNLAIIKQSFIMSLQNIRANKMRSFLTMLGIVIGVGAVIGLITIVEIVSGTVMGSLSGLGADMLTINAYSSATKDGLTDNDIKILDRVEGVKGVSPTAEQITATVAHKEVYSKTRVQGRSDLYFLQNPECVAAGRAFTAADMNGSAYVCIVDEDYIRNALLGRAVLGSRILINGVRYTIVGVAKKDDSLMSYMTDTSRLDGTILVPYKNVLSMTGKTRIYNMDVYIEEDYFSVINMESLGSMMDQVEGLMSGLLGGIASISLLVGGIGIMNMMLVSVSERTKEIGLRKALGAAPSRIQLQFLIESIVLSVIGGLIGIALGMTIAYVASAIMQADFTVSFSAIALGVGFSAGVGIIFGWFPAKRASELNPIDALRAE